MSSAVIVDIVLVFLVVETVALLALLKGRRFVPLLPNLAAGLFLVLALRQAVQGAPALWIGVFVALGGVAHAVDLLRRLRQDRPA